MTPQRKVYLGLLVLAMVALVLDRVVLEAPTSSPRSVAAAAVDAPSEELEAAHADRLQRALQQINESALSLERESGVADQLRAIADRWAQPTDVPDAFALPSHWKPETPTTTPDVPVAGPDRVAVFKREHKLQAVMHRRDGAGIAIINGQSVQIGQRIGGFTLRHVRSDSAILERGDERVELSLEPSTVDLQGGVRSGAGGEDSAD